MKEIGTAIFISCLAQSGFAAFGEEVQLISGSPYVETEQLSKVGLRRQKGRHFLPQGYH